jgi:hypothetical protein
MDGWDVLLFRRNLQLFVQLGLVLDAVIAESCLHVERLPLALPGVALGVHVDLFISIEDFPDRLLPWNFELIFCITEGVDDPDELTLLGELADEILLVLPPGNSERVALEF